MKVAKLNKNLFDDLRIYAKKFWHKFLEKAKIFVDITNAQEPVNITSKCLLNLKKC